MVLSLPTLLLHNMHVRHVVAIANDAGPLWVVKSSFSRYGASEPMSLNPLSPTNQINN